jgi:hypothetical protein
VISPFAARFRPAGSGPEPAANAHVFVPLPPVAASVCVGYTTFGTPTGSVAVVTSSVGFTVTDSVSVTTVPPAEATTVSVADPAATAVTTPSLLTIATLSASEDHARAGSPMSEPPESIVVAVTVAVAPVPPRTNGLGDSVSVAATCPTVTCTVPEAEPDVAVIVATPLPCAVISPVEDDTLATEAAEDVHVTDAPLVAAPFWSRTVAVGWPVSPKDEKFRLDGATATVAATGVSVCVGDSPQLVRPSRIGPRRMGRASAQRGSPRRARGTRATSVDFRQTTMKPLIRNKAKTVGAIR